MISQLWGRWFPKFGDRSTSLPHIHSLPKCIYNTSGERKCSTRSSQEAKTSPVLCWSSLSAETCSKEETYVCMDEHCGCMSNINIYILYTIYIYIFTMLYYIMSYYMISYYIISYYIISYYIALYYITLYSISLHYVIVYQYHIINIYIYILSYFIKCICIYII